MLAQLDTHLRQRHRLSFNVSLFPRATILTAPFDTVQPEEYDDAPSDEDEEDDELDELHDSEIEAMDDDERNACVLLSSRFFLISTS